MCVTLGLTAVLPYLLQIDPPPPMQLKSTRLRQPFGLLSARTSSLACDLMHLGCILKMRPHWMCSVLHFHPVFPC